MDNQNANIAYIERLRINSDGDGVCTIVHTYGCNLNCRWCSNPETRYGDRYRILTAKELYDEIKIDNLYYISTGGGITFSGGEPLLYSDFIAEFSHYTISQGWKLNVETAFNIDKTIIDKLIRCVSHFFIDIKSMDNEVHIQNTGVSNAKILDNISYLTTKISPDNISISYPIITGVNDSVKNLSDTCQFMNKHGIRKIRFIPYRDTGIIKTKQYKLNNQIYEYDKVSDEKLDELINYAKEALV